MKESRRNWSYIIIGLLFIFSGFALLFFPMTFYQSVSRLVAFIIGATGVTRTFQSLVIADKSKSNRDRFLLMISGIAQIIFALWIAQYTETTYRWLLHLIGYYQLIMGIVSLISYILLVRNQEKRRFHRLAYGVVHLIFAVFSFTATKDSRSVTLILGVYAIFIGFTYVNDGRGVFIQPDTENKLKRKVRFPLPIIFNALLPTRVLNRINQYIAGELDIDVELEQHSMVQNIDNQQTYDVMQILIHAGSNAFDIIGHMNIVYKEKVYSYGNHDIDSRQLFDAIGDGVLVVVDKDAYIDFSIKNGDNLVIEYDVLLNQEQTEALVEKLAEIKSSVMSWRPTTPTQLASYGGELMRAIPSAQFYKFVKGKFKTYFVFGTNCVMLSDEIIGTSGLDLFLLVGILTPGTYYDYLEKEFQKANSIVISRKVHHNRLQAFIEDRTDNKLLN
ncbi:HdeD family acid-resistance protein [Fundicoccus culcitae]|uniref:DUF308 domain-containing protein n=1 Tax=Fundicoccus culcitae TaxID=2969821 RepID=A0ABY5P3C3_9LACT|nr:DUF308 domain-containing protein [Fundicoccus culcitae]UUX33005.1 DUF308 domain-containing protein [Fundicoccus culcitae]